MLYAAIDHNIITNIFNVDDESQLPICQQLVKVPDGLIPKVGDFYIDNQFKTNYNGNEELDFLKILVADLYKIQKELSQRIYQLEKTIF